VQREQCAVHLHREVLPSAERAADPGEVDPYLLLLEPEAGRDLVAVDVEPLRRDVDVDPALAVRNGKPGFRPEECLVLHAELVDAADRDLALSVRVAVPDRNRAEDVRALVVAEAVARGRVLLVKRLLLSRALRVDDRLERLVLDLDPLGRAARLLRMLGGDERDRLAEVAHPVDREHRLVGELQAVGLRARNVRVREHPVNAGHGERLRDVDLDDPRVRVRAADGVTPEHPRGEEVARVRELAGHLRDRVDAARRLADPPQLEPARGRAHVREAARRTASKIFA